MLSFYANGKNTDRGSNLSVKRDTAFSQIVVSSGSRGSVQAQNRKAYPLPSPLFLWHMFHPRWKSSWKGAWSGLYREAEVHWIVLVCPSWDTLSFSLLCFLPFEAELAGFYQWTLLPPVSCWFWLMVISSRMSQGSRKVLWSISSQLLYGTSLCFGYVTLWCLVCSRVGRILAWC